MRLRSTELFLRAVHGRPWYTECTMHVTCARLGSIGKSLPISQPQVNVLKICLTHYIWQIIQNPLSHLSHYIIIRSWRSYSDTIKKCVVFIFTNNNIVIIVIIALSENILIGCFQRR